MRKEWNRTMFFVKKEDILIPDRNHNYILVLYVILFLFLPYNTHTLHTRANPPANTTARKHVDTTALTC